MKNVGYEFDISGLVKKQVERTKEFSFQGYSGDELSVRIFQDEQFSKDYLAYFNQLKSQWIVQLVPGHTTKIINKQMDIVIIHPSTRLESHIQMTYFDKSMNPVSHATFESIPHLIEDRVHELILESYYITEKVS